MAHQLTPSTLENFRVGADRGVHSIYYVPAFCSEDEEGRIMERVAASRAKWKVLSGRRFVHDAGDGWALLRSLTPPTNPLQTSDVGRSAA